MKYLILALPQEDFLFDSIRFRMDNPEILRTPRNPAHVTLFNFLSDDEKKVRESFSGLQYHPFTAATSSPALYGEQSLVAKVESDGMLQLHDLVCESIKDLIEVGDAPGNLDEAERKAWKVYGSRYFGPLYNPHITLGKLVGDIKDVDFSNFPFGYGWTVKDLYLVRKEGDWNPIEMIMFK